MEGQVRYSLFLGCLLRTDNTVDPVVLVVGGGGGAGYIRTNRVYGEETPDTRLLCTGKPSGSLSTQMYSAAISFLSGASRCPLYWVVHPEGHVVVPGIMMTAD